MSLQPGVLLCTRQAQFCSTSLGGRAGTGARPVEPTRVVGLHPPGGSSVKGVSWWHLGGCQQWTAALHPSGLQGCSWGHAWPMGRIQAAARGSCCKRCQVRRLEGGTHPSVLPG